MMKPFAMSLALLAMLTAGTVMADDSGAKKEGHPVLGQQMKSLSGESVELEKYRGKVLLIVNTASECGATPQYGPLQKLHEKYSGKGLAVLGFPCNQFGQQEPGTEEEIAAFCQENYGVTFDMFAKINVNGENAAPLYAYLTSEKSGAKKTGPIRWNFEKFVISRDGEVVARFGTGVRPESQQIVETIERELAKKAAE